MEKKGEKKPDGRTDPDADEQRTKERTNEHHKKIGRKSRGECYRRERSPAKCTLVAFPKVANSHTKYNQRDMCDMRQAEMML